MALFGFLKSSQRRIYPDNPKDWIHCILPDGTVELVKYTGTASQLTVPNTFDGKWVSSIGIGAFRGCQSLTVVSIAEGIKTISQHAFRNCDQLTEITIPASVSSMIGNPFPGIHAVIRLAKDHPHFGITDHCLIETRTSRLIAFLSDQSGSFHIPESVTSIGKYAFWECKLTEILVPDGVVSIDNAAFSFSHSLRHVNIPNRVSFIGDDPFASTPVIIRIPESHPCYHIENNCLIEKRTGRLVHYQSADSGTVRIPEGVVSIGDSAFNSSGITKIEIPASVRSIGSSAFMGCGNLTRVTIPGTIDVIKICVFSACRHLTEVILLEGVCSIGSFAFDECGSLCRITIPGSVTEIDDTAFNRCPKLSVIAPPNSYAMEFCRKHNIPVLAKDNASKPEAPSARYFMQQTSVPIEKERSGVWEYTICNEGTAMITGYTGSENRIMIPSMLGGVPVTSIGSKAFYQRSSLVSVTISEGIRSIGSRAFSGCENLTSMMIPDGVVSVGAYAFQNCRSLTRINLPRSISSIGEAAFRQCRHLTAEVSQDSYAQHYCMQNDIPAW